MKKRAIIAVSICAFMAACGAPIEGPNNPFHACPSISKADFDKAIEAKAAKIETEIKPNSGLSLKSGMIKMRSCSKAGRVHKRCVSGQDIAVSITQEGFDTRYAIIKKGETYRFNASHAPNVCEIVEPRPK